MIICFGQYSCGFQSTIRKIPCIVSFAQFTIQYTIHTFTHKRKSRPSHLSFKWIMNGSAVQRNSIFCLKKCTKLANTLHSQWIKVNWTSNIYGNEWMLYSASIDIYIILCSNYSLLVELQNVGYWKRTHKTLSALCATYIEVNVTL